MADSLKKLCEAAIAGEHRKRAALRALVPKVWDSDAKKKLPHLRIQATPQGEEMVYQTGIYMVDVETGVEGKPRKHAVDYYIAEADSVAAELNTLSKADLETRFAGTGIYVHGVIPKQAPATIEGANRVAVSMLTLVVHAD